MPCTPSAHRARSDPRRRRHRGGSAGPPGSTVSDVTRDGDGRADGVIGRDRPAGPCVTRPPWSSAPTGRSPRSPASERPPERAGTGATAVVYGYWPGLDVDGYHWVFRRDASAGDPHQRRVVRVRRRHPREHGHGRVSRACSAPCAVAHRTWLIAWPPRPSLGRPRVQSVARAPAGPLGAGLGPGRRRRLLEGSHRRPRPHRCAS